MERFTRPQSLDFNRPGVGPQTTVQDDGFVFFFLICRSPYRDLSELAEAFLDWSGEGTWCQGNLLGVWAEPQALCNFQKSQSIA